MLGEALRICIMTRLCSRSFGLTGQERLGIAEVTDIQSPYYGRVPIPPILDAQIDELWIANMMKSRKALLSKLKAGMFARVRETWLETFLTTFIVLSNLEFCYQQKCRQMRRHIAAVGLYNLYWGFAVLSLCLGRACTSFLFCD
jgi:hypothetical protein